MKNYKKPFVGVAYYPEDWDESEIDYDISKMNETGSIVLKEEMTDMITQNKYSGKVELAPYDVLVLKR